MPTKAEAVFDAMTTEYQPCERCDSRWGRSWPADGMFQSNPHEFYCDDCIQDSVSQFWGMGTDGVLHPNNGKHKFVWHGKK